MTDSISSNIIDALDNYDKYSDRAALDSALATAFAAYYISDDKEWFEYDLKEFLTEVMTGYAFRGKPELTIPALNEKLQAVLHAVETAAPELMMFINQWLPQIAAIDDADDTVWIGESQIPFYDVLSQYPSLQSGLSLYIDKYLRDHVTFPGCLNQIKDSPHARLVTS